MTAAELRAHMDQMAHASTVLPMQKLLVNHTVSCVDGRKEGCIVGAPGGNMGLFMLLLATLEQYTSTQLREEDLRDLFERYLEAFGHFYMHTDDLSLDQARQRLSSEEFVDVAASSDNFERWMRNPPSERRSALLEVLTRPDCTGCGHVRLMLEHPNEYHVRVELVRQAIKHFFEHLWEGDERVVLDVLEGTHAERAVVRVHVRRAESDGSEIVLACPRYSDKDIFVYHPEAASYLTRQNAEFLAETGRIGEDQIDTFVRMQQELGQEQLSVTLRYLAPGIPVFDATFDISGSEVTCTEASRAA